MPVNGVLTAQEVWILDVRAEKTMNHFHIKNMVISIIIAVLLIGLLKKTFNASALNHSIWSVFFLAGVYSLVSKYEKIKVRFGRRQKNFLVFVCILFSAGEVLGIYLTRDGSILAWDMLGILYEILLIAALAYFLTALLSIPISHAKVQSSCKESSLKIPMYVTCIILLLGWLPVLLAYYPGIFAYDASNQVMQVIDNTYTTHHPLIHTILLGTFFKLGQLLQNNNIGVLLYSILQMGVSALMLSWSITYMIKKGLGVKGYILLLAIYILFPVYPMMSISTTKDILFAAFSLTAVVFFMKVSDDGDKWKSAKLLLIGGGALVGMMLFRNNAVYACIICCPILLLFLKKKGMKHIKLVLFSVLITVGINGGMNILLQPAKGSIVEMMSVPLQQMARVGYYHEGDLEESLKDNLYYYIPSNVINNYAPNISDGVKNYVDENKIKASLFQFIKTYIKLGIKYPREYADAFACVTQGFWYIEDTSNAEIYGSGMDSRLGYMLTNYKVMPKGYEVEHNSGFPELEHILEKLFSDNKYQDIPVLSLLFSPAFYGWAMVLYIIIGLYLKSYRIVVPILILFLYHLSLLLGPTCIIRYVYPIVICLPVLYSYLFLSYKVSFVKEIVLAG